MSVTSHRHDAAKALRCARAGVGAYWIVDEPGRLVRVHTDPHPDGYRRVVVHGDGEQIHSPAGAPPVAVSELLG